jgi:hypothetical protein
LTRERFLLTLLAQKHLNPPPYIPNNNQPRRISGKREITFSDMYPEIVKLEENKSYYEDLLNLRLDVLEGRKEREEFFKKKYPHLF